MVKEGQKVTLKYTSIIDINIIEGQRKSEKIKTYGGVKYVWINPI